MSLLAVVAACASAPEPEMIDSCVRYIERREVRPTNLKALSNITVTASYDASKGTVRVSARNSFSRLEEFLLPLTDAGEEFRPDVKLTVQVGALTTPLELRTHWVCYAVGIGGAGCGGAVSVFDYASPAQGDQVVLSDASTTITIPLTGIPAAPGATRAAAGR